MINTIWTNEDLKQIKKVFKAKLILKQESDNVFTLNCKEITSYSIKGGSDNNTKLLSNVIKNLFELTNKDEIDRIIRKYSNTEFDSNNSLHYGLISTLSKLTIPELNIDDSTYCTQIFIILNEIISQYDRIITLVTNRFFRNITEPDEIKIYLDKIKNNELELDKEVLFLMQKVFSYTNGLNNEPIFKELITECNNEIKQKIISRVNALLSDEIRKKVKKVNDVVNSHEANFSNRYDKGDSVRNKARHCISRKI